jgi:dual specificity tyrosine-phosphorylation-regulated kinase 2/3/4
VYPNRHTVGEFFHGERIYHVEHLALYQRLEADPGVLKALLRKLLEALDLLQHRGIVHADLKPDNILIDFDFSAGALLGLKLIDFGSAFLSSDTFARRISTPEYMPPESLEAANSLKLQDTEGQLSLAPWSVDIWSAGAVLLEILTGVPLWMSFKTRIDRHAGSLLAYGAFAVQGKIAGKIVQKQRDVATRLSDVLSRYGSPLRDPHLLDLLQHLLDLNPRNRLSPREALQHPYLAN